MTTTNRITDAQWTLIKNLELNYISKQVPNTPNNFTDSIWSNPQEHDTINWNELDIGQSLMVLLKVLCFETLLSRNISLKTFNSNWMGALKRYLIPMIKTKKLLTGNEDNYQFGLNNITDEDLSLLADSLVTAGLSQSQVISTGNILAAVIDTVNVISSSVPFYHFEGHFPWRKEQITPDSWFLRRASDLHQSFRIIEGYAPLSSETVNLISEKSLNLIYNFEEHLVSLSQTLTYYDDPSIEDHKRDPTKALEALASFGNIFINIISPPIIESTTSTQQKIISITVWIRKILYLARGACVNVILLTTGLRNVDLRQLKMNCCSQSRRADMLYYLTAHIKKTSNKLVLPVPEQTYLSIRLLQRIKFSNSVFLIDSLKYIHKGRNNLSQEFNEERLWLSTGNSINKLVRDFAAHFNIPFTVYDDGSEGTAHCYRTTVAGWLGSASNLSVLLVKRLFGHSNEVMPTVYLRNNPTFIEAAKKNASQVAKSVGLQIALATSKGQIAGSKGIELERGYKQYVSLLEQDNTKSHSLTDIEIVSSFADLLTQRILDETLCGFLTPFGVICARNPNDTTQPPCARRAHRDLTDGIEKKIIDLLSDVAPEQCIGTGCDQALLGPWSVAIRDSLLWYEKLLSHQHGDNFKDEHFLEHARQFIKQYGTQISKVFKIHDLSSDSSKNHINMKVMSDDS